MPKQMSRRQKRAAGSLRYCQHKLSEIQSVSRVLAKTFSGQGRLNLCFSDVSVRYTIYADSFQSGQISRQEYEELVGDLLRLRTVDQSGCSTEAKAKLADALDTISKLASLAGSL